MIGPPVTPVTPVTHVTQLFRFFACDWFDGPGEDGTAYLRVDYATVCYDEGWFLMLIYVIPALVVYPLGVRHHQPSAISHQPPVIGHRPSGFNHQPSVTSHQSSAISHSVHPRYTPLHPVTGARPLLPSARPAQRDT